MNVDCLSINDPRVSTSSNKAETWTWLRVHERRNRSLSKALKNIILPRLDLSRGYLNILPTLTAVYV